MAAIAHHQNLLAVVYRGEDILLWDTEQDRIHDIYEKDTGSRANGSTKFAEGTTTVNALAFSTALETYLLAAAFADGDLVVYDTLSGDVMGMIPSQNVQVLASSPDGRTLARANSSGDIFLLDFETLRFLYRISFDSSSLMAKSLAFTADGLRLIDVRAFQCRVWQPTVLLRQDVDDENSDTVSISTGPQEIEYQAENTISITAVVCVKMTAASVVFCGKDDGTVHAYDIAGEPQSQPIFTQTPNCSIQQLHFDDSSGILSCANLSGRVTTRKVVRLARNKWGVEDPLIDIRTGLKTIQLLTSAKHSNLLVVTEEHDTLWPLDTQKQEHGARVGGHTETQWVPHPTNLDVLIHCNAASVELCSCLTLKPLHHIPLPTHIMSFKAILSLHSPIFFGSISYEAPKSTNRQSKTYVGIQGFPHGLQRVVTCRYYR